MPTIKIAIIGNGNLGRACKQQILERPNEFSLVGIFSRRQSEDTILLETISDYQFDVALFCGGSSTDAPAMVPELNAKGICTVDSYDNHGEIKNENYQNLIKSATEKSGTTAIVGAGWDPGYLSLQRILNIAFLPTGVHNTLYGGSQGGLSMGHTNAIKKIEGVIAAHQITMPREDAKEKAKQGIKVASDDRHKRLCFVVAENGKEAEIEKQIRNMEGYYKNQQVEVNFISLDEFTQRFSNSLGHGGQIISTDSNTKINLELEAKSNPLLTANGMLAFAKANYAMQKRGWKGVFTIDEVPLSFLLEKEIRLSEI